jgi:hypothetical protein
VMDSTLRACPVLHAESCGSLCATLAYMFVLAARGGVLDQLDDTTIRTLVSMRTAQLATLRVKSAGSLQSDFVLASIQCIVCTASHARRVLL